MKLQYKLEKTQTKVKKKKKKRKIINEQPIDFF